MHGVYFNVAGWLLLALTWALIAANVPILPIVSGLASIAMQFIAIAIVVWRKQ